MRFLFDFYFVPPLPPQKKRLRSHKCLCCCCHKLKALYGVRYGGIKFQLKRGKINLRLVVRCRYLNNPEQKIIKWAYKGKNFMRTQMGYAVKVSLVDSRHLTRNLSSIPPAASCHFGRLAQWSD